MAKSFGPSAKQKLKEQAERGVERLWELIESDFSTLKRECKIDHPCKMTTLGRIREQFDDLQCCYENIANASKKSEN
jgi:hypothetical protein